MGGGTFDAHAYHTFTTSTVGKSTHEIYGADKISANLNPYGVKVRESRDSPDNPQSTPLIVGLDVTGSMGMLADTIAREGLGVLFTGVLDRKPITNPHVMFMGLGDAHCDRAPLQVSQFEADNRIVEQLTQLYLEHGGGGNDFENYDLAWYFAAFHTTHDSMVKRGKRGYLFTVGDEEFPKDLPKEQIKRIMGDVALTPELTPVEILEMAQRSYDVYHIVVLEGSYASRWTDRVLGSWREKLGQKVIPLADHTALAQTIVSAIEVAEGRDAGTSSAGWGAKATVVHDAIKALPKPRPLLGHP